MNSSERRSSSAFSRTLGATGVMLATVSGSMLVVSRHDAGVAAVVTASVICALGTTLTAVVLAPLNRYPRWSYWTVVGFFALLVLATPGLAGTPERWVESVRPQVWFLPWFFLTVAGTARAPATGRCSPEAPGAGRLFVAMALAFAGLVALASVISFRV